MSTPRLVVLYGAKEVGKTALVHNRLKEEFKDTYEPTKAVLIKATKEASGVLLNFFDLPGYKDLSEIESNLIATVINFSGGLLVFSVNSRQQFDELPIVLAYLQSHVTGPICLVGNKADLVGVDRSVSTQEADKFAAENDISYFEVSVKAKQGVDYLFEEFVKEMNQYHGPEQDVSVQEDDQDDFSFGSDNADGMSPIPALATGKEVDDTAKAEEVMAVAANTSQLSDSPASVARRTELDRMISNRNFRSSPVGAALLAPVASLYDHDEHLANIFVPVNSHQAVVADEVVAAQPSNSTLDIKPIESPVSVEPTVDPELKLLIADIKARFTKVGNSRVELVQTLLQQCEAAKKMDEAITALKTCGKAAQKNHEDESGSRWFFGKGPLFFKASATKTKTDELVEKYSPEVSM